MSAPTPSEARPGRRETVTIFVARSGSPTPGALPPPPSADGRASRLTLRRKGGLGALELPAATVDFRRSEHVPERFPYLVHEGTGAPIASVHSDGSDAYVVQSVDGVTLAQVTYRPGRFLRRARWSVELAKGSGTLSARKGSWYAWLCYGTAVVVGAPLVLLVLAYGFFEGGGAGPTLPGSPSRTRFRLHGSGTALDHRGVSNTYRLRTDRLDLRIGYALVALHHLR